jgi:hypothetical protein
MASPRDEKVDRIGLACPQVMHYTACIDAEQVRKHAIYCILGEVKGGKGK